MRDEGLLDLALESAFATFGGNKRIGIHIMFTFLELNGTKLVCTNEEVIALGLGVDSGQIQYDELLQWILDHME